eukprot:11083218-Lingulodinium_polyedra.AAC.1
MATRRVDHLGGNAPGGFSFIEGQVIAPPAVRLGAPGPRDARCAKGRCFSGRSSDNTAPGI